MDRDRLPITLQQPHVHLTKRAVWALFGETVKLTPKSPTDMPGKFVAAQTVTVTGPNGASVALPITGPSSPYTQVELTVDLAGRLGVDAKIEPSGKGTAGGVTVSGPEGSLTLDKGVLIPQPHFHLPPEDASTLSLLEGQTVTLATPDGRILEKVLVRVNHLTANRIHLLAEPDCPFTPDDVFHVV
ncbi:MAG: PduL/EutD family phosphate acyltransferase [Acutalibacteraceae bacterium]